jgi:hypothetical protein
MLTVCKFCGSHLLATKMNYLLAPLHETVKKLTSLSLGCPYKITAPFSILFPVGRTWLTRREPKGNLLEFKFAGSTPMRGLNRAPAFFRYYEQVD